MDKDQIKQFIAEKVAAGLSLSQIQDELKAKGEKMTFIELRLIASEIESGVWKKQDALKAPPAKKNPPAEAPASESEKDPDEEDEPLPGEEAGTQGPVPPMAPESGAAGNAVRGKTTIAVSPIQRPGFVATGSVTFGSGANGDWFVDQSGRLGFSKLNGKPDRQDVDEFQMELSKQFGA